jgi:predicted nucleic acid-binding protein
MVHNRRSRYAEFAPLIEGHPLALPFAVVGELRVGAIRGGLQSKRLDALNAAIKTCVVIPTDARIVNKWAELRARFLNRLKGEGINDLWIAACCIVHGLPVVTNNLRDFGQIADEFDGLRLVHPDL